MRSLDEKRALRRFIYSRVTIVVLLLLLVLLLRSVFEAWQKERQARSDRDAALSEVIELDGRTASVQAALAEIQSGRGQERELREKYGAAKPGEEVIVIVENQATATAASRESRGLWQWFSSLF